MASGRPISVNGMAVRVIFWLNSTPWVKVTRVASSTLMSSTFQICCSTEPRSSRNSFRPEGRSRTIMGGSECSQAAGAVCMLPVCR